MKTIKTLSEIIRVPRRLGHVFASAVDVFVYDTRDDSDGGAWRTGALALASSWYNETLNTATRGSRREFPAVAVIVAEANKVTIYDGDDPSLPMWMVFNLAGGGVVYTTSPITSIAMKNGWLWLGANSSGYLSNVNFISDVSYMQVATANKYNIRTVLNRNFAVGPTIMGTVAAIVSRDINSVAMTVLPDAPIDPATGLPVPTIAVATAGGVSVIKDDGTVVDITGSMDEVGFTNDYRISFSRNVNFSPSDEIRVGAIPVADVAGASFGDVYGPSTTPSIGLTSNYVNKYAVFPDGFVSAPHFTSSRLGISVLLEDQSTPAKGMVAYITSTYNTGWMVGDVKGAFLANSATVDRSVNALTLPTVSHTTDTDSISDLPWFTFSADVTVTLLSDISASGEVMWWEKVAGVPHLYALNLAGGNSHVDGDYGTPPSDTITFSGANMTIKAGKTVKMVRLSATIASADQHAKIYRDEADILYAPATLYGTSDAVTAMGFDKHTKRLSASTSQGISTFRGLRRVAYDTTPAPNALSVNRNRFAIA